MLRFGSAGKSLPGARTISIESIKRDWGALERKLRAGRPLACAAEEAGIPLKEAQAWASELSAEPDYLDLVLRASAGDALASALTTLRHLSERSESDWMRADAAKALARLAFDVVTKIKSGPSQATGGKGSAGSQRDLFDAAADLGPWKLTVLK